MIFIIIAMTTFFFDKVFTSMVRLSDQGNKCYDHDYGVDHQHDGNEYKFDVEQGWLDYLKKTIFVKINFVFIIRCAYHHQDNEY